MSTANDKKFMQAAINLSRESILQKQGGPFGAVIVKDQTIIGQGRNQVTIINDPTAHAEVQAIRYACQQLNTFHLEGSILYTSCEPCPMCLSAAYWARIKTIYFAANRKDAANINFLDDFIYNELAQPTSNGIIHKVSLLRENAVAVMQEWHQQATKIMY